MLQDALNDLRSERKSLADRLEKVDAAIAAARQTARHVNRLTNRQGFTAGPVSGIEYVLAVWAAWAGRRTAR